jgi:tRNA modification GTPase
LDTIENEQANQKWAEIGSVLYLSAKKQQHLSLLKERMLDSVLQEKINTESTIVTNARHYHALQQVLQALQDTQSGLENKLPSDLIALEIRRCIHYLGEITGEITNEDQLDYIFSKFCIGK